MRKVKDIIASKQKPFNIISPSAFVIEGVQLLNTVNLSYLIVMEEDQFKGVFSERDYTRNVVLRGRSSKETKIHEVMTTDLPRVELRDTVEDCMKMMNNHGTRYLVAFDDEQVVGIITIHDILRQVLTNKEEVFDHALTRSLLDNDESGKIF